MFDRRRDAVLTLEASREVGGVAGALSREREELYLRLNQAGPEATRQLFLRLVTLGKEGPRTRDGGSSDPSSRRSRSTRRPWRA